MTYSTHGRLPRQAGKLDRGVFVLIPFGLSAYSLGMMTGNKTRGGKVEAIRIHQGGHMANRVTFKPDAVLLCPDDHEVDKRSGYAVATLRRRALETVESGDSARRLGEAQFLVAAVGDVVRFNYGGWNSVGVVRAENVGKSGKRLSLDIESGRGGVAAIKARQFVRIIDDETEVSDRERRQIDELNTNAS